MPKITELKTIDRGEVWEVLEDFKYKIRNTIITVPKNFITDYASVPRIFRNIINSYGKHGKAAVVHDWLYSKECRLNFSRKECDKIFLEIMKECNVAFWKRNLMYRLVRMFGASHFKKGGR